MHRSCKLGAIPADGLKNVLTNRQYAITDERTDSSKQNASGSGTILSVAETGKRSLTSSSTCTQTIVY